MNSRTEIAALALAASAAAGCYSSWDIQPQGLVVLNGFREGQTRVLYAGRPTDEEGAQVPFNEETILHFRTSDGAGIEAKYREIDVTGPIFRGVESEKGRAITVDLRSVMGVEVKNYSTGRAVGVTAGIIGGSLGVVGAVTFTTFLLLGTATAQGRPLRLSPGAPTVRARLLMGHPRGAAARRRSRAGAPDAATNALLFAYYAGEASAECASITAFHALARDLRRSGAPTALVERALRAAQEEVEHTRICEALANEYGVAPIKAQTPDVPPAEDKDLAGLLARMALESFWDGCLAEGASAAAAQRSARRVEKGATAEGLGTIARDEQGHAELGSQVVDYCIDRGGRAVRNALLESFAERRSSEEPRSSADRAGQAEGRTSLYDESFARSRGVSDRELLRAAQVEAWERGLSRVASL